MGETAEGLLIANYHFTIIIHYVLAITFINQLCKQLAIWRGKAGCGGVGECNLNFNILSLAVSSNGKGNRFYDIYVGQFEFTV